MFSHNRSSQKKNRPADGDTTPAGRIRRTTACAAQVSVSLRRGYYITYLEWRPYRARRTVIGCNADTPAADGEVLISSRDGHPARVLWGWGNRIRSDPLSPLAGCHFCLGQELDGVICRSGMRSMLFSLRHHRALVGRVGVDEGPGCGVEVVPAVLCDGVEGLALLRVGRNAFADRSPRR